ncbi:hypothetical protein GSY74_00865 [Sulfurovum sp. bin170]|uniref:hypothetical protein n=1 Tax=Sulfurovum sp. bin170 TaxID=2695268 RepID=UPI0013E0CD72|nr:hypothetical protein [Sulfurovum sp. bin170]NEW59819.1 hypothetical protein [Sulfurovum sp. bin170]
MTYLKHTVALVFITLFMGGCISASNDTVVGGTPDVTQCSPLEGVLDGADFVPKSAISEHENDGRTHPDLFFIAWSQLDARIDLRSPEDGYDNTGFEDKLLVSRKQQDGGYKTWQIYPSLDNECKDVEKVRIQSFDVAPDGKSLYLSMSKPVFSDSDINKESDLNPERNLGIFKMDIASKKITPITTDYGISFSYPTYIGNDKDTDHEMLLISKTVTKKDIPINYKLDVLRDEYDKRPAPLIHKLDTVTGAVTRIGFNNSHQTEPVVINQGEDVPLVIFTEWEHQATVNRFSLWKMQIDGSDTFMFYGEEAATDDSGENIYQARQVKSGKYKDYILMGQSARRGNEGLFLGEGDILMTKRVHLDLRSDKIFLSKMSSSGVETDIARTPEHYNDESFVYAYREDTDSSYKIYIKDFPEEVGDPLDSDAGAVVISSNNYHFMQPRSFYPPVSKKVAPGVSDLSENRVSFTNDNLNGKSGFLVENLLASNNGVQHQLNGISKDDIRMQFFIPAHDFSSSYAVGTDKNNESLELTIPSSDLIETESDGSLGIVLKEGLYVWKVNKKFPFTDGGDIWIPIRAERQEVSFVPNRVNECNQCHQDRNQGILDQYHEYYSIAHNKMRGNLSDVLGTDKDISDYNATEQIPDFHKNIIPLLTKPAINGGGACVSCHNAKDKLNLSNKTGVSSLNSTYRNFVLGAHKMPDDTALPYNYSDINPMGIDDKYHPAPFLWSLILNDDLTLPEDGTHPDNLSRDLDRDGDYGATYSAEVSDEISRINGVYNHSKHWSREDTQKIITYGSTRLAVGLSDRMSFDTNSSISTNTKQAQKAYQAMVRSCYECHNNHTAGGMNDLTFEDAMPKEKRFSDSVFLRDTKMRFVIRQHIEHKGDTKYSKQNLHSNLENSKSSTLSSALYRVDFDNINNSELLVYARGYYIEDDDTHTLLSSKVKAHAPLAESDSDYIAMKNWLTGVSMSNQAPTITKPVKPIVMKEYDVPAYLEENLTWSDADDELSQLLISKPNTTEHAFSDAMLALEYNSFVSAKLKAYAILGDRGEQNLTFRVTDGLHSGSIHNVPVTVTSDYEVPRPSSTLPDAYLFFMDRNTSMLRKMETNGTITEIGTVVNFDQDNWQTMYRRADKGWLYFIDQENQVIHVIDETDASEQFEITLNHEPNKETRIHKQTLYLIWWRPAEGSEGDDNYRAGRLEGLLESKFSETKDGDWYVDLGDGENSETTIIPNWQTKLVDGGNTLGVYVWRRATFMTKWVNEGIDRMNVLNLETGKAKYMTDFNFTAQTVDGVDYSANTYWNARALVVAEDGAFYGFNKDLNVEPEVFNFDPILGIQKKVDVPQWIQDYINNYQEYATPFLVIEPRP